VFAVGPTPRNRPITKIAWRTAPSTTQSSANLPIKHTFMDAHYLVTAKHVVDGWNTLQATIQSRGLAPSELMIHVNPVSVMSEPTDISLSQVKETWSPGWTDNPDGKDISVLSVNIDKLQPQFNVAYFPDDVVAADRGKLKELTVSAGDGIFVLGFPMGLTANTHSAVIVREGIIARIEDLLYFGGESFLIDSFLYFLETAADLCC
jgi:hypothetical protein